MTQRHLRSSPALVISIFFFTMVCVDALPAFKFKKIFSAYDAERYPSRAERRLVGEASPIHFITPYVGIPRPMHGFNNFFAPQSSLGNPSSSSIFKLPLRLYSNGKPHAIFHGLPKSSNVIEYFPQTVSNIIKLPLKFMSNAKPVGVYFKDPAFNYLWNNLF